MRNVSNKICTENQNTHFMFSISPPPPRKSRSLWDTVEKYGKLDRPQMTTWRMRFAPKATNTHSEYVILLLFHCNNGYTNVPECYFYTRSVPKDPKQFK